jgi:DNA-directed RNA polymerase subunit RPC12/RpoP
MAAFAKPSLRSRSVIASEVVPAIRGQGTTDYVCGGCDTVLAEALSPGQLQLLGFRCPECGTHSEPPAEVPMQPSGGTVLIPVGIYRITATLRVTGSVPIHGERSEA